VQHIWSHVMLLRCSQPGDREVQNCRLHICTALHGFHGQYLFCFKFCLLLFVLIDPLYILAAAELIINIAFQLEDILTNKSSGSCAWRQSGSWPIWSENWRSVSDEVKERFMRMMFQQIHTVQSFLSPNSRPQSSRYVLWSILSLSWKSNRLLSQLVKFFSKLLGSKKLRSDSRGDWLCYFLDWPTLSYVVNVNVPTLSSISNI
jgi:hypothetical protein